MHKISFVQHLTRTHLNLEHVRNMCKTFLKECALKVSCVRSSHELCAHAHVHSLEGTLFVELYSAIVIIELVTIAT